MSWSLWFPDLICFMWRETNNKFEDVSYIIQVFKDSDPLIDVRLSGR